MMRPIAQRIVRDVLFNGAKTPAKISRSVLLVEDYLWAVSILTLVLGLGIGIFIGHAIG